METVRLFVYGSLKRGFRHHDQLSGARFLGEATTQEGHELRLQGGYPALVPGTGVVRGELYEVSREHLAALDAFEGAPDLYQRTPVRLQDGSLAEAYTVTREAAAALPRLPGATYRE